MTTDITNYGKKKIGKLDFTGKDTQVKIVKFIIYRKLICIFLCTVYLKILLL